MRTIFSRVDVAVTTQRRPAARAARSQAPSKPFHFLDLPGEVRNIIYRLRLVCDPNDDAIEIHNFFQRRTVRTTLRSGQILRTCRQVYREAVSILYGENRWKMMILNCKFGGGCDERYSPLWRWPVKDIKPGPSPDWPKDLPVPLTYIRRFEIFVRCANACDMPMITDGARDVGRALLHIQQFTGTIESLRLTIQLPWTWTRRLFSKEEEERDLVRALMTWLGRLRNVKHVEIYHEGVSCVYVDRITRDLQSSEPSGPLPDAYEQLESSVGHIGLYKDKLNLAQLAVEREDGVGFEA